MRDIIEIKNIKKYFKLSKKQQKLNQTDEAIVKAVDDVSFSVKEGEIYGLLGPNGAGKTTALRLISTLIKQDSGEIFVNSLDTLKDPLKVRAQIGFLTSELKLENFFTPNFLFDFYSDLHNIDKTTREERKEMLFERFDITHYKEVKIGDLSTGMKQKVSLAISLAHDPKIIIFDEPTNGLDVLVAKIVVDFLLELKEQGYTLIVSTHVFSLVEKICDRIGLIFDGKLVYEQNMSEIEDANKLEELFFEIYEQKGGKLEWKIFGQ